MNSSLIILCKRNIKEKLLNSVEENNFPHILYKMDFEEVLKSKRSHLTAGSLKTYNSLLKSIYKSCFGVDKEPNIKNFDNHEKILDFLKNKSVSSRKTYLAALVCIAPNIKEYKDMMNEDMSSYKKEQDKQILNDKQLKSNITSAEIKAIYNDLENTAKFLYKKTKLDTNDLQQIQNYIIVALLGGIWIVPRRSLDFCELRIRGDIDKNNENYIDKKKFVFFKFKTAKFHEGGQSLDIPTPLMKILTKWISVIPNDVDHLLFNAKFEPLTNVTLNQRLNKIFKGPISVNQMRHTYLTEKYGDMMKVQKEMEEDMEEMGSSTKQAKVYVKYEDKK